MTPRNPHCRDCGVFKTAENSYLAVQAKDGSWTFKSYCKKCHNERVKAHQSLGYGKLYKQRRRRQAGVAPFAERFPLRTQCPRGHPMDGAHNGRPRCLTCHREQARQRARAKGVKPQRRTHCPQGHELTLDNIRGGSKGRSCALCHRLRQRRVFDADARRYAAVIVRDPCSYCGGPGGTVDHIKALANGGSDDWHNLTGACHSCNARKRTIELLPFLLRRVAAIGETA